MKCLERIMLKNPSDDGYEDAVATLLHSSAQASETSGDAAPTDLHLVC